jgi:DNA-binding SARP family transcriptional activator
MEFRILGSLEVRDGDRTVPVATGRQRALLALLLLHANETISTDRLVEELWGGSAPATALKVVQNHVSGLRRSLADGLLVTRSSGYALELAPGQRDLDHFEELLEQGRGALASGDALRASELLREALALWRGPPLADFAFEPFAQAEIARLEERRLVALEERIDADLALGRHADLVGELESLIATHPLRERPRGQLMLALYRSRRQAEALAVYRHARRTLVDELGIEPSPELQELERAILQQDPSLEARAPATRARPRVAGPLIGRQRELAALLEGLDAAISGRGRLFAIGGDPGIGKSRLADELAEQARERGAVTLFGRAWEAGGAPAYWPWVQAIRSYMRDRDSGTVREQLGTGAADVAQMLPELRDQLPDVGAPPSADPEGARFRLFDATSTFLRRAANAQSLVVVLDDLHAADTPSLLLLEFIAQELADTRILVLGLYRDLELGPDHPLSSTLIELARRAASSFRLTGLPEAEVARFIEAVHGVQPPGELATAIQRETEGNPLFVGEVVRLLAAEGRLEEAVGADALRAGLPASVRDVIGLRLRRLSDDCKRVLALASVLGREFDLDALARVGAYELDPLLDLLEEAVSARVVGEVPGAHGRLRFAHVLIRDTLYEEVPATRRLRLHRQVGEALEGLYANDLDPHLTELAYHFDAALPAGDAEKAVEFARRAGDRAATLLAYEEAERLYGIAIAIVEAHAAANRVEHCELLLRLGDVRARAGDIRSAKESFLRAAEIARDGAMAEQLARAALGYGGRFVWSRAWGDTRLVPLLEEALAALPEEDSELRVRLLTRLAAGPLRDTLPPEPREEMSQAAVDMARRLGNPATLAYALEGRYDANWGPDVLESRLAISSELIEVAQATGDAERLYAGYDSRFVALLELGDLRRAYQAHKAGARLAAQLRQPAQLWDSAVRRTMLALFEGRFDEAEGAIREMLELGLPVQSVNAQLAYDLQMYALRREQGRLEEVTDVVDLAVDAYPGYPVWRYVQLDVLAELGREDEARAALEASAAQDYPMYLEMQWLFALSLLPEVCRYLENAQAAAEVYELLRPYAHRNAVLPPELCRGSVSRGLGILAATTSRWSAATRHFEDALEQNDAIGARPWLAHTQYDYAWMLRRRGATNDRERASELLASAAATSEALGMPALAGRVADLSGD